MKIKTDKEKTLATKFNLKEVQMLAELVDHLQQTQSSIIRRAVVHLYNEIRKQEIHNKFYNQLL